MDYEKKQEIPFGAFDSELMHEEISIPEGFEAEIKGDKIILKKIESEDERIRKVLVELVKCNERCGYFMINNTTTSAMLAWLERQGKQKTVWHNEDEEPKRGSLILLIMQSGTPIVAKIIEPNHTFNHGERWAYIDDLLEKQGEKKPTDKVEPKFKVGDWVVVSTTKGDRVVQIAYVEYFKDGYQSYITTEGRWFGNGTKARLLTDKDVETITLPESKVIVHQKSAEWSEEDEQHIRELESLVKQEWAIVERKNDKDRIHKMRDLSFFLKTLKPQLKQEWDEEDETVIDNLIWAIANDRIRPQDRDDYCDWLKSLKQRIGGKQ